MRSLHEKKGQFGKRGGAVNNSTDHISYFIFVQFDVFVFQRGSKIPSAENLIRRNFVLNIDRHRLKQSDCSVCDYIQLHNVNFYVGEGGGLLHFTSICLSSPKQFPTHPLHVQLSKHIKNLNHKNKLNKNHLHYVIQHFIKIV